MNSRKLAPSFPEISEAWMNVDGAEEDLFHEAAEWCCWLGLFLVAGC